MYGVVRLLSVGDPKALIPTPLNSQSIRNPSSTPHHAQALDRTPLAQIGLKRLARKTIGALPGTQIFQKLPLKLQGSQKSPERAYGPVN